MTEIARCCHPLGWQYFWSPGDANSKISPGGISTEDIGQASPTVATLTQIAHELSQRLQASGFDIVENDLELYFPLPMTGAQATEVYVIDHEHKSAVVYKLDDVAVRDTTRFPVTHRMQQRYWEYMAQHPAHHSLKRLTEIAEGGVEEALGYLAWCSHAALTSPTGAPHPNISLTHAKELSQLLINLRTQMKLGLPVSSTEQETSSSQLNSNAVLVLNTARVLSNKYDFYDKRGFWTLGRDKFVRDADGSNDEGFLNPFIGTLISIFSVILLFSPKRFEEIRKSFIPVEEWQRHVKRLTDERRSFNLLATVVLVAAVSFLSVANGPTPSTATLVCALGSVLSGLYCSAHYQAYVVTPDTIEQAIGVYQNNLFDHHDGAMRRRYLSIILALPEALLLWSIISFIVAIISFSVKEGFHLASFSSSLFLGSWL